MGKQVLKNWSPRKIISFLKKNGFIEIPTKGDHCGLFNPKTRAYTEIDKGRDAFTQREMMGSFVPQTKIPKEDWLKY